MIVLSGDVGGTNTRLQLSEFIDKDKLKILKQQSFKNNEYNSFVEVIADFFKDTAIEYYQLDAASFGAAGPVIEGVIKLTNLPWMIKIDEIKNSFAWERVFLLNDFEAIGYGLDGLKDEDILTLQVGNPRPNGLKAYIGAGTGLGVGFISYHRNNSRVHPTEGGHVDFAPANELQMELLKFLRDKYQRVSFERVVSGIGISNIYQFLSKNGSISENTDLKGKLNQGAFDDWAPIISKFALEQQDPLALETLELFVSAYGVIAGNLALTTLPRGGLYVVGGIAPKMVSLFEGGSFLNSFNDKGRIAEALQNIPVYFVLDTNVGLNGAAFYAIHNSKLDHNS